MQPSPAPRLRRTKAHVRQSEDRSARAALESLEAERQRLYRDVHDGPAQVLANAIFDLEHLDRIADRAPAEVRNALRTEINGIKEDLRRSLETVRAMIFDLRPPVLSELGLAGALRVYADEYESRYGLRVECEIDERDTGMLPEEELGLYRIMQEALQNTHKHARASRVSLAWARADDGWTLVVADDGVGFDLAQATRSSRSVGLLAMRERAELIGGSLDISSRAGGGTTVHLALRAKRRPATGG